MRNALSGRSGRVLLVLLLGLSATVYLYGLDEDALAAARVFFLEPGSNIWLFLLAVLILPLLGLPLSAFCLMAGAKFGIVWGLAAIGGAMLIQQLLCFWLMHSYFRERLYRLISRRSFRVPRLTPEQQLTWGVSTVAIPILPYMLKNIVLAAGQLSLWQYLLVAWPIQMLFSFPFVALTGAVRKQDTALIWIAAASFIVVWLGLRWLQLRRRQQADSSSQ